MRVVIRQTLFGDFEMVSEENYLKRIEDGNEVKRFPWQSFSSYEEVEEYLFKQEIIPADTEIVRL